MITEGKWIYPEAYEIDPAMRYPASYLRRRFTLDQKTEATLSITCHGLYVAFINGKRVGNHVLEPGPGNYPKRLEYQKTDVSALLQAGENTILIILGDGWFRGCTGIDGCRNLFGNRLALLCTLEDLHGNVLLQSDEAWEASQSGPIRADDLEQGETYDALMEEISDWHPVLIGEEDKSVLVQADECRISEHERFPGKLIMTPNGERVLDFSQNLAGYVRFSVNAEAGGKIVLWHGETLDENGNFTQANYDPGDRNREGGIPQKIVYTCKEGLNEYAPSFSIFGFRYAKVETDIPLESASFEAVSVYSDMEEAGYFECSDEDVNQLFRNAVWSMKSNFCGIPTDCPTRERAGWTGDAGVFVDTGMFLMDCEKVYRKWLREVALGQSAEGVVPNIAPPNNLSGFITRLIKGSAGWGDAAVIVPMALYRVYGDKAILEENYPMMKAWVGFLIRRARKSKLKNRFRKNPYRDYLMDTGFHFGEWCEPDVDSTAAMKENLTKGVPELATAYFYRSAALLSEAAGILGKTDEKERYAEVAENAKNAWRYWTLKDGKIESKRQADYVRALAFGLLDGEEKQTNAAILNGLVKENGYHLNTGFLSTPYICQVLADYGYVDSAYRLLLQKTCPSWLYAVGKGATTIWENWDAVREDGTVYSSLNHYSYGAVCRFLFSGICGIQYENGEITIAPQPDPQLRFAKARWKSPVGIIQSEWRYENGKPVFTVSIPAGKEAKVILPDGRNFMVRGEKTKR